MELLLRPQDVAYPLGLSISVEGFKGDTGSEIVSQVFIEVYKGKLRVHVWSGGENPVTTEIDATQPRCTQKKR